MLTNKEKREHFNYTIGRLRVRLRDYHKDQRGLDLLEKLATDLFMIEPLPESTTQSHTIEEKLDIIIEGIDRLNGKAIWEK